MEEVHIKITEEVKKFRKNDFPCFHVNNDVILYSLEVEI